MIDSIRNYLQRNTMVRIALLILTVILIIQTVIVLISLFLNTREEVPIFSNTSEPMIPAFISYFASLRFMITTLGLGLLLAVDARFQWQSGPNLLPLTVTSVLAFGAIALAIYSAFTAFSLQLNSIFG